MFCVWLLLVDVLYMITALEYMKSVDTIVEEDERVYLKRLYDSEVNICKTVADMIDDPDPFTFDTNFECEPLKTLASDKDQVK